MIPSVERSFKGSALFMRPLTSAVLVAACPFLSSFLSVEFARLLEKPKGNALRNAGLPLYIFFLSLCLVRCSLLIGRMGALSLGTSTTRFCRICVLSLQVLAFVCISLLLGMAYSVAVAFGTKQWKLTALNLLPLLVLVVMMIWSICVYRRASTSWSRMSHLGNTRRAKLKVMEADEICRVDSSSTFGI